MCEESSQPQGTDTSQWRGQGGTTPELPSFTLERNDIKARIPSTERRWRQTKEKIKQTNIYFTNEIGAAHREK